MPLRHDSGRTARGTSMRQLHAQLQFLTGQAFSILDVLPESSLAEKITSIVLDSVSLGYSPVFSPLFGKLRQQIEGLDTSEVNVVVFGGGTGLSNIVGGDSRRRDWAEHPFTGLKTLFPNLCSVVCVTDDGGSTGELLKDLPLIALGDLRHVLVSSIREGRLVRLYDLDKAATLRCAVALHGLFNYRFISRPVSAHQLLLDTDVVLEDIPPPLLAYLRELTASLFTDPRLMSALDRPQCLGNLFLAAAICRFLPASPENPDPAASRESVHEATLRGLADLAGRLGARSDAVLPCTTAPSELRVLYGNGVLVTSEEKSSRARRGYPVDRVLVDFCQPPVLPDQVLRAIDEADIILFAPGSLYTSIIPILQVPGLAGAIRVNRRALKMLIANIWVQSGETDAARDAPERKFYVSDLIRAYHRNIPGGVHDLFSHVIALDMTDIPGSILQRYALENKEPIYIDRNRVRSLGFGSIEARVFSENLLHQRSAIQHDSDAIARAVKGLWALQQAGYSRTPECREPLPVADFPDPVPRSGRQAPCLRYAGLQSRMKALTIDALDGAVQPHSLSADREKQVRDWMTEVLWLHPDIPVAHLDYIRGITLVARASWQRQQRWDNVYSFYDPEDCYIKIRDDQAATLNQFERAFLVGLGQSLLGNYAEEKTMDDLRLGGEVVGRLFRLQVRPEQELVSWLEPDDISVYLGLSRMRLLTGSQRTYIRTVNLGEGFTPPGLFFGLFYSWYLDNRFAANIEYKMSIMRHPCAELIPEQIRISNRRQQTITFFRERIFRQLIPFPVDTE
jgi:uncharacterized cofD-like protein